MVGSIRNLKFSLIFAVFLIAPCLVVKPSPAAAAYSPRTTQPELIGVPEMQTPIQVEGRIVPANYVQLSPLISGHVTDLRVQEGDLVQAGTLLMVVGDRQQLLADIQTAKYELIEAQQELDDQYMTPELKLAKAEQKLAVAEKAEVFAADKVRSTAAQTPEWRIEQARVNLQLAENALERTEEDLQKVEKRKKNKEGIWYWFLDDKDFRNILRGLERVKINAERRVIDAKEKYEDLQKPVDQIDLALAQSDWETTQANVAEAARDVAKYQNGPDLDVVALLESRIRAAEIRLIAAEAALSDHEVIAPISGKIVELKPKAGEWVHTGEPVVVIADDTDWVVETEDLTEIDVINIHVGQAATVELDALPGVTLTGEVNSIKDLAEEKRGDVTYTVVLNLLETDPRLRWGMTTIVTFE
jgi:multidrug resistance efflux pump